MRKREFVLITGPNGAGKTTLVETCLGILRPLRGRALLLGVDTCSRRIMTARKECSYVPQDFMRPPHDYYTAEQVIRFGLASLKEQPPREVIEEVTRELEIDRLLKRPIGTLSGGQQQRVFLARALIRKPRVLFLDEPFSSLDEGFRRRIAEMLRSEVDESYTAVVMVSHDTSPVRDLADRVVLMSDGRVKSLDRVEGLG